MNSSILCSLSQCLGRKKFVSILLLLLFMNWISCFSPICKPTVPIWHSLCGLGNPFSAKFCADFQNRIEQWDLLGLAHLGWKTLSGYFIFGAIYLEPQWLWKRDKEWDIDLDYSYILQTRGPWWPWVAHLSITGSKLHVFQNLSTNLAEVV